MTDQKELSCGEVFRRLDDYLDRALTAEETALVEQHLEWCVECAGEYKFEAGLVDGIREKLSRIDVPKDLLARISERLHEADRDDLPTQPRP